MSQEVYDMPLATAIRKFTLAELVEVFEHTHPAFFAAVIKEATRIRQG